MTQWKIQVAEDDDDEDGKGEERERGLETEKK